MGRHEIMYIPGKFSTKVQHSAVCKNPYIYLVFI